MLDLAEINLPFLDEPHHPKLGRYTKPHTLAWAHEIDTADALVIVTPEYNSGFPAPLKNAIDFLHAEWKNKALGMVTYGGGASGGARAGRMLQPVTTALGLVTRRHTVAISRRRRSGRRRRVRADRRPTTRPRSRCWPSWPDRGASSRRARAAGPGR